MLSIIFASFLTSSAPETSVGLAPGLVGAAEVGAPLLYLREGLLISSSIYYFFLVI